MRLQDVGYVESVFVADVFGNLDHVDLQVVTEASDVSSVSDRRARGNMTCVSMGNSCIFSLNSRETSEERESQYSERWSRSDSETHPVKCEYPSMPQLRPPYIDAIKAEPFVFEHADDSFCLHMKHSPQPRLNPETTLRT